MSKDMPRRRFLHDACRWASLAVLGGWLGGLALRPPGAGEARAAALCAGCASLGACAFPEAVRARQALSASAKESAAASAAGSLCGRTPPARRQAPQEVDV